VRQRVLRALFPAALILALLAQGRPVFSQGVPLVVSYQGYLTTSTGVPVNTATDITFRLYDTQAAPAALWSETHAGVPVANGSFSVMLGSQQPLSLALFDTARWLGVQAAGNAEMTPRQMLGAAPFAIRAASADVASSVTGTVSGSQITGTITGASVPGATPWSTVGGGTSQQAASNAAYVVTGTTRATITLPASPAVGDVVKVASPGAGGFTLVPGAGHIVTGFNNLTQTWTPGAGFGVVEGFAEAVASSADGTKLVALGIQVHTSTDSGATWTPRGGPGGTTVASSADGTKLVSASGGEEGGLLHTSTDSGATWTPRDSPRQWVAVASSADGTKLVALADRIYTSTDSGATWTPRESPRNWSSVASSADGTKLVAAVRATSPAGADGEIYTSADSGVTWTPRDPTLGGQLAPVADWRSVASSADGNRLVAVAVLGWPFTSTDGGVTWSRRGPDRQWGAVVSSADGSRLAALTDQDRIYTSTDAGATWFPQDSARLWRGLASSADGNKLVAIAIASLVPLIYQIYTFDGTTTISGPQFSTVEMVYGGSGTWIVVNQQGSFTAP
jgi:hypothetical protein